MGIQSDILDDLCSRFLVNLPDDQRRDAIRVCFQAELAHWFYVDYYCVDKKKYPTCKEIGVREFIRIIFHHCDFLAPLAKDVDAIIDQWREYKSTVPTYGAIILDSSLQYVLLVQGFYARNSWGFPKGKVNEEEHELRCASREVEEETGFNIESLIDKHRFLCTKVGDNVVQLYIIVGVPRNFDFRPRTRNEIKKIQWFKVDDLPLHKNDDKSAALGIYPNHFFGVCPFVDDLRQWIAKQRQRHYSPDKNRPSAFKRYSPSVARNLPPRLQKLAAKNTPEPAPPIGPIYHAAVTPKQKSDVKLGNIRPAKAWTNVKLDWVRIIC